MQQTLDTWDKALSAIPQDVKEYRICKEILEGLYANRLYLDPKLSLTKFCSIVGTDIELN